MKNTTSRLLRGVLLAAVTLSVASCGLPRSGPSKNEIFEGSVMRSGDAFVVSVNSRVTRATSVTPALGFSDEFVNAGVVGSDTIRPGDTLGLTIWENVDDGLLSGAEGNATTLQEVQVDGAGFIFVPYAGRIKAAGNTPEAIRRIITNQLEEQTPDPQVEVRRLAGDGAAVSVIGSVGGQGLYPIERPSRNLSGMLARAGGITIEPEIAQITVVRGNQQGEVWFQDIFDDTRLDIALRNGDRVLVEQDTRSFTSLGATGNQTRVPFESQTISAIEAIATVGGLQTNAADPTGVFVFRNEPAEIANMVLGRDDLVGDQRLVYVLNLTEPTGMFEARDFAIRDEDTLYVTEAPFVRWNKTISALLGGLNSVNSLAGAASGLGG
ncbi:MAG: polysaccharide biosynthesis/export family protein [Donghicola eburneus]|nr:polysaccharide biosynthesis/export family protein [Donghicola eburneus]MCI5042964.1 polysaccharide biosynthesis/export family protein [Donghicola eburneus]